MSQLSSPLARGGLGTVPTGEEVASFATYAEAQHAVDSLSDDGFPVQYLAIIGTDLRQVERITGRMSWGRAVASGAGSGLWIGIFFAAMMGMFSPSGTTGVTIAAAVLMGVVWGILFQAVAYGLTRGKRDFTSVSQVVASRYSIIASEQASEAAQALASVAGNLTRGGEAARRAERRRAARDGAGAGAPTAFGSRLDEQPRFGVRVPEGTSAEEYAARAVTPRSAEEAAAVAGAASSGADGAASWAASGAPARGAHAAPAPAYGARISSAEAVARADEERAAMAGDDAGEEAGQAGSAVVTGEAGTGAGGAEDPYLRPAGGRHRAGGDQER